MRKFRPETQEALYAGRIRFFVFFVFMFFHQRVPDGDRRIDWDGHVWGWAKGFKRKTLTWGPLRSLDSGQVLASLHRGLS